MRVLIHSFFYQPDPIGIAPLVGELSEDLAKRGHRVSVVTSFPHYPERVVRPEYRGKLFQRESWRGVDVVRCYTYVRPRPGFVQRSLTDAVFMVSSLLGGLAAARADVILCVSPPLSGGLTAYLLSRLWRIPFIFNVQDLVPDAAVTLGLLRNPGAVRFFKAIEGFVYARAAAISVISQGFVNNLLRKKVPEEKIALIHNWVDVDFIRPLPRQNAFRAAHGLGDAFVVLYSGNIALSQGLDSVLDCAAEMSGQDGVVFVIAGAGSARADLEAKARRLSLDNVRLLGLQPREVLPEMLAAADVSLVTQKASVLDINLPSKTPVIMASGRALIAAVNAEGDTAKIVGEASCGLWVEPENPTELARAILFLKKDAALREEMGGKGREYAVAHFARSAAVDKYEQLLERACGQSRTKGLAHSSPRGGWRG